MKTELYCGVFVFRVRPEIWFESVHIEDVYNQVLKIEVAGFLNNADNYNLTTILIDLIIDVKICNHYKKYCFICA